MKQVTVKVAGVSFDSRQQIIEELNGGEAVLLQPEPTNRYDPNAIAVWVDFDGEPAQVGYLPREFAAFVAPLLEGESILAKVSQITGGFELWDGSRANYGLLIQVELPDDENHF